MKAPLMILIVLGSTFVAEAVPEPAVRMEYVMPTDSSLRTRARAIPCYNKTQRGMGEDNRDNLNEPCVPTPMSSRRDDRPDFEQGSPGSSAPIQKF